MKKEINAKIQIIRSGGQTGADRAALDTARKLNIPITGWVPKDGWAEDEKNLLEAYPELKEVKSKGDGIWARTERNVRESDATLIFYPKSSKSFGTDFTRELAEKYNKPVFATEGYNKDPVIKWINSLPDDCDLNIAGPRESESPGIYFRACFFLEDVLKNLT